MNDQQKSAVWEWIKMLLLALANVLAGYSATRQPGQPEQPQVSRTDLERVLVQTIEETHRLRAEKKSPVQTSPVQGEAR